jgi:hypothetical protein
MKAVRKVLIPTDFTVKSLNLMLHFIKNNTEDRFDILLAHGYSPSSSITDLLFFSKPKLISKLQTSEFEESCQLIQNTYRSRLRRVQTDIITGFSKRYFDSYVEANDIDLMVLPQDYKFKLSSSNAFDICPYIAKSKVEVVPLQYTHKVVHELEKTEQVADLFLSNVGL